MSKKKMLSAKTHPVKLELRFASKEDCRNFVGGLMDGWGENEVHTHFNGVGAYKLGQPIYVTGFLDEDEIVEGGRMSDPAPAPPNARGQVEYRPPVTSTRFNPDDYCNGHCSRGGDGPSCGKIGCRG